MEATGAPLSFTSPSPGGDLIPEISASFLTIHSVSQPTLLALGHQHQEVPLRQESTLLCLDRPLPAQDQDQDQDVGRCSTISWC